MGYCMGTGIFLEAAAKPLLVLHAVGAAALLGSSTHAAYEIIQYLRGKPRRPKLERLHAKILLALYSGQFLLGAIIYPTYRVNVRAHHFDAHLPWASNLFDIKEMFAAFGLVLVVAYWLMSRKFDPHKANPKPTVGLYAFCGLGVAAIVWFSSLSGFFLTTFKAV